MKYFIVDESRYPIIYMKFAQTENIDIPYMEKCLEEWCAYTLEHPGTIQITKGEDSKFIPSSQRVYIGKWVKKYEKELNESILATVYE